MTHLEDEQATADLKVLLAGCRDDLAALQADMDAIKARLGRTPTLMGWMVLAVAYLTFVSVAVGLW